MPNGEGYPDPTADIAIWRVTRQEQFKYRQNQDKYKISSKKQDIKKHTKGGKAVYNYDMGGGIRYDSAEYQEKILNNTDGGPGSGNWGHGGRPGKRGGSTGGGGVKYRQDSKESGFTSEAKKKTQTKKSGGSGNTSKPQTFTKEKYESVANEYFKKKKLKLELEKEFAENKKKWIDEEKEKMEAEYREWRKRPTGSTPQYQNMSSREANIEAERRVLKKHKAKINDYNQKISKKNEPIESHEKMASDLMEQGTKEMLNKK